MALVHLEHVTKRFGADRPPATDGLSFTVESGRILALLGPSGCGKTTTLRLIAGFETPDQGRIAIAGQTVADADRGIHVEPEARGVGVVFRDSRSFPTSPSRRTSASGPDAAGEAVIVRRFPRLGEPLLPRPALGPPRPFIAALVGSLPEWAPSAPGGARAARRHVPGDVVTAWRIQTFGST